MPLPHWEHFEHQADIGLRGYGATLAEAFEQIACALTAVVTDLAVVEPREAVDIRCSAANTDCLLVEWLNALIYEGATRRMLFSRFTVRLEDGHLQAVVRGEKIESSRHHPAVEVKAATYHALAVEKMPGGGWMAQCVVDV